MLSVLHAHNTLEMPCGVQLWSPFSSSALTRAWMRSSSWMPVGAAPALPSPMRARHHGTGSAARGAQQQAASDATRMVRHARDCPCCSYKSLPAFWLVRSAHGLRGGLATIGQHHCHLRRCRGRPSSRDARLVLPRLGGDEVTEHRGLCGGEGGGGGRPWPALRRSAHKQTPARLFELHDARAGEQGNQSL